MSVCSKCSTNVPTGFVVMSETGEIVRRFRDIRAAEHVAEVISHKGHQYFAVAEEDLVRGEGVAWEPRQDEEKVKVDINLYGVGEFLDVEIGLRTIDADGRKVWRAV